jgi:hypothetical protein
MRFCALLLCLNVAVLAEEPVGASDVVAMVTASLAVDRDDQRIAEAVASAHLSERLPDATVAMLRQMGAGRETVYQLQTLARKSRALPPPSEEPIGMAPEPSASERTAMIDVMLRYAVEYLASLPNFVCTREARQFRTGIHVRPHSGLTATVGLDATPHAADKPWGAAGSYTAEAAYAGGVDRYKLTLVDGKPTTRSFEQLQQRVSWGEFAGAVEEVFGSGANFEWDRWEVTGGKRSAVFAYHTDATHSHYTICCPPALTAHRGFVYADPQSGAVRRIIIYATGLTKNSPMAAVGNVVDYREVAIGDRHYLLPRTSVAYSRAGVVESREDIDYRSYRKFGADATVAFPAADQPQP